MRVTLVPTLLELRLGAKVRVFDSNEMHIHVESGALPYPMVHVFAPGDSHAISSHMHNKKVLATLKRCYPGAKVTRE